MYKINYSKASLYISVVGGFAVGYISWNGSINLVGLASLVLFAYFFISKKINLFAFIFSYRLASSYPILMGIVDYTLNGYILGFFLWLSASFFTTMPWILFWSKDTKKRFLLFPLAILFTIVPPVGLFDGNDPITAVGLFFSGAGYIGIVYFLIVIILVSWVVLHLRGILKQWITIIAIVMFVSYGQCGIEYVPASLVYPLDTRYSFAHENRFYAQKRQKELLRKINDIDADIILLPEHIFGEFKKDDMQIWHALNDSKMVIAGAYIYDKAHLHYDNVLLLITNHSYRTIYTQHLPVPVAMWRPYANDGARAHLWAKSDVKLAGKHIGMLLCYEAFIPYIYLQVMTSHPDYLLASANLWWSKGNTISDMQRKSLYLWSRLFGIGYIRSVNR